jgi:hypothetical protein
VQGRGVLYRAESSACYEPHRAARLNWNFVT